MRRGKHWPQKRTACSVVTMYGCGVSPGLIATRISQSPSYVQKVLEQAGIDTSSNTTERRNDAS